MVEEEEDESGGGLENSLETTDFAGAGAAPPPSDIKAFFGVAAAVAAAVDKARAAACRSRRSRFLRALRDSPVSRVVEPVVPLDEAGGAAAIVASAGVCEMAGVVDAPLPTPSRNTASGLW